jgi:PXA domain
MSAAAPRHRKPQSIASSVPTKTTQQTLARRLLAHPGSNDDLPPLLATQSLPPEITAELYDFIALALRAFVNTWWTKITRYDKEFLPHINKILTYVIGKLEERLVATELAPLVFQDIPTIVTQHYIDYRNAQDKLSTSYASGGASSLPALFAHLQPHMAILPDGQIDSEYYRQIVDQILRICLPPEDYEPEVQRSIIREIIVKIVVTDIIPKLSQPWFIHKAILDLAGTPEESIFTVSSTVYPIDSL